ncbi:hypothetical protein BDQ17DRAFT_1538094 [Cyathus striatus]|nr:hypothetical protein BDQ17DRAFT_1538094 [Cyathus striatus]
MSYFPNASNFIINRPTFVDNQIHINNGRDAMQYLSQYIALGATHDSGEQNDAPKCHPETRKQLLSDINQWIKEPDKETGITYLHGPAGAGKSSIARSVCEEADCTRVLASFFFWRGSQDRNNAKKLFTTIAYQLAMQDEVLAGYISSEIQLEPRLIYDASIERQFRQLILEPYLCIIETGKQLRNGIIVIDGLDECIDITMQKSVLRLFAKAVHHEGFPLGFFITSRPELHLREEWDTKIIASVTQLISLSSIQGISQDIQTVLESGFSCILNDRRFKAALKSVPRPWPPPSSIWKLVERSSGQFIYAATVMKFISSPHHNPNAQLEIVLGIRDTKNSSPLADLDLLYHEILSRVEEPERTIKVLGYILAIMEVANGNSSFPYAELSYPIIRAANDNQNRLFLIVEQLLSLPPGEAFLALNNLHSLIDLNIGSESYSDYSAFQFHHKSFQDFLTVKERSKGFYVDLEATHVVVAESCLNFLTHLKYETAEQHVGWLYAFFCSCEHMDKSSKYVEIPDFFQPLQKFFSSIPKYSNSLHFQEANNILGIRKHNDSTQVIVDLTEALMNNCSPSVKVIQSVSTLWLGPHGIQQDIHIDHFRTSIIFPLFLKHLKSYNNDAVVKQLVALHVIIPFPYLTKSSLLSAGIIPDLKSSSEMLSNIHSLCCLFRKAFLISFLNSQFSGSFHCTSGDFADAHITIIRLLLLQPQYPLQETYFLHLWARTLLDQNQSATPALLAALETAAQEFYEKDSLNKSLTHEVEEYLFSWLKKLPDPPQTIIDAWQKAFTKAQDAAEKDNPDYFAYFCPSVRYLCPTQTCPGRHI